MSSSKLLSGCSEMSLTMLDYWNGPRLNMRGFVHWISQVGEGKEDSGVV